MLDRVLKLVLHLRVTGLPDTKFGKKFDGNLEKVLYHPPC